VNAGVVSVVVPEGPLLIVGALGAGGVVSTVNDRVAAALVPVPSEAVTENV
jgi:hypothetical protein